MIGFWNHLDVVPAGNDWENPPFEPVRNGSFLQGRGVQDNKGPAIGILYMMQCIRELQLPLNHELRLFVGCDEERGMDDLVYYTAHYPTPALSMIADAGFPVCYGEKGILEGTIVSDHTLSEQFLHFSGGNASNMIPDRAQALLVFSPELKEALFARLGQAGQDSALNQTSDQPLSQNLAQYIEISQKKAGIQVTARGIGKHSAFPYGSRNAIHVLCSFLMDVETLHTTDREILKNLAWFSGEFDGEHFGIRYEDQISGKTTCAATILTMEDQRPALNLNIRYSIPADSEYMNRQLNKAASLNGMVWRLERDSAPNYFPKEHPAVDLLTKLYCEITGTKCESYVMGGGTYARKLPNAFAYGVGGMQEAPEDIELRSQLVRPGHGGAHEPDEILNVRLLTQAMKIYTMSVIALNDCPLKLPECHAFCRS
ncbi:MAG: Sapep family Mn(2+)-dependent dipeptidase [Lachnospiraceae bacterium]|nr:Sapep family Mn(2+)-dependent dipeptidase [Lachnospiraceae bacterium]